MQQEQTTENVIEELILESKIYRFASELQMTTDETRKGQLRNILSILQRHENTQDVNNDLTQKKLDILFDNETTYALKKSWGKLNHAQHIDRISHFVRQMVMDQEKKQKYEEKLISLYEQKKLKKSQVLYDESTGEIKAIDVEV